MPDWCVTRGMSWEAVNAISRRWRLEFGEVPVAGPGFYAELAKVRPDWDDTGKWPMSPNVQGKGQTPQAAVPLYQPVGREGD